MAKRTQLGRRTATESEPVQFHREHQNEVPAAGESQPDTKGPGRPPGAKNRDYVRGERHPGMCPKCKCTDSAAESTRTIPLPNDADYKFVSLIKCMCKKCGQWRVDRQKCNPAE